MPDEAASESRSITLYEAALDALPSALMIHDHQTVLFANLAALEMLGAPDRSSIEGRPLSEIVHPDGVDAGVARRRIVLDRGHAVTDVPVKLVGFDGVTRYATVTGRPITYGQNEKAILVTASVTLIAVSEV